MKLSVVGVGQAGGRISDEFLTYDAQTSGQIIQGAVAINTAKADLDTLERVPRKHRVLIGQDRVQGQGTGADNDLGARIAEENIDEIEQAIDGLPTGESEAFIILAGLGGGTGSGGAPVIARNIKQAFQDPVYGLGILPTTDEGRIYTLNAARSFRAFVQEVDTLFLFDNDAWQQTGESLEGSFDTINEELVRRFGVLFRAGEIESGGAAAQSIIDSSEIINTLASGGIATVGYATAEIDTGGGGLLSWFKRRTEDQFDTVDPTNRITSLVRQAALGRLTLPCDLPGTGRALVLIAGPPDQLTRKGIEQGRKWIEEQTGSMQVRGGDYPIPGADYVAAVVLLSGVSNVSRLDRLQQKAVETGEESEDSRDPG